MGREGSSAIGRMTASESPPDLSVCELTVVGPGYGECIIIHIGNGNWVIVDSCLNKESSPVALSYLQNMGLDPTEVVRLIVATHWHDDHIRGMSRLVEVCDHADFCCASVVCTQELLTMVGALSNRPLSESSSGLQELYQVMSLLTERTSSPLRAISNRLIFNQDGCEIWSLSPFDRDFDAFLQELDRLIPKENETKRRIASLTPNKVAIVLLVKFDDTSILLGSDLERQGWLEILEIRERPRFRSSVFKIPHHGSTNANEDRVWTEMLDPEPIAAVTPWRMGGRSLPTTEDVRRVLSYTSRAYATVPPGNLTRRPIRRSGMVDKTIRESGINIRRLRTSNGMVRLRKEIGNQSDWDIELIGSAYQLAV